MVEWFSELIPEKQTNELKKDS